MTGRGISKTIKHTSRLNSNNSDNIMFGRGRRINLIPPIPGFPM
jgi:hypothetical protein